MQPLIGLFIPCGLLSHTPSSWVPLLASGAAVTKHLKLRGLKRRSFPHSSGAGSPKSDCRQGRAPSKASRRGSSLPLVFGGPGPCGLVAASLWSVSVPIFTWRLPSLSGCPHLHVAFFPPPCLFFPSHKDTSPIGLGPILSVMPSQLFLNKVTFSGVRGWDFNSSFGGMQLKLFALYYFFTYSLFWCRTAPSPRPPKFYFLLCYAEPLALSWAPVAKVYPHLLKTIEMTKTFNLAEARPWLLSFSFSTH